MEIQNQNPQQQQHHHLTNPSHPFIQAPSSSSAMPTIPNDPFSAAYKADPGQLPVFSLDHYSKRKIIRKHLTYNPIAAHQIPTPPVFSPALAGERDREARQRLSSEHYNRPSNISDDEFVLSLSTLNVDEGEEPQTLLIEEEGELEEKQIIEPRKSIFLPSSYRQRTRSSAAATITHRSNRTFLGQSSPSTQTQDLVSEKVVSNPDERQFSIAIDQAIKGRKMTVDLDNKGLTSIPTCVLDLELLNSLKCWAEPPPDSTTPRSASTISHRSVTRVCSAPAIFSPMNPSAQFTLILSNNYLSTLGPLVNLKSLRHLSLRSNRLETLPDEIANLELLEVLNLNNNRLRFLPSSIHRLKLCTIYVSANPWIQRSDKAVTTSTHRIISEPVNPNAAYQIPTLIENCMRRLCLDDDGDHLSLSLGTEEKLEVIAPPCPHLINQLSRPNEHFWRCDGCKSWRVKSEKMVESYEFTKMYTSLL
ncbi:hypothetical protein CROQUDRAFT_135002 [Cronartium quercuum f. sp. fusiforme G11]|uniref:L domain-like protein n=1 Tax=Cronartium quercuum f. sp. fusiforme G11 TaxID=708437 RepID=A0A9P6ND46_9BASI|nr:hypothetical protein CROQUDRAFT_135002 [Cronartium quercuum f. sp. fusiforme G11]